MPFKSKKLLLVPFLLIAVFSLLSFSHPVQAEEPVVHAVLFYSPTCPHCEEVIANVLPPLVEKYGLQLRIFAIDTTTKYGNELYQAAVKEFDIPNDRRGVPTMIIGEYILVGGTEIPQQLPGIIEEGLAQGGLDYTYFPGLEEALNAPPGETPTDDEAVSLVTKFKQDLAGNTLSVIVLMGMIAVLIILGVNFEKYPVSSRSLQYQWIIPVLAVIGLGVAGYLSFVESTHTEAICGPVGDCNTVQQSPYATLFGFLPIGILGAIGYVGILLAWVLHKYGPQNWNQQIVTALWGFALFGTLFSIYLTFLEPFVIGATCLWCLSSATIITILLWFSTDLAKAAWKRK